VVAHFFFLADISNDGEFTLGLPRTSCEMRQRHGIAGDCGAVIQGMAVALSLLRQHR
jgi:hypothetical protein